MIYLRQALPSDWLTTGHPELPQTHYGKRYYKQSVLNFSEITSSLGPLGDKAPFLGTHVMNTNFADQLALQQPSILGQSN